MKLLLVVKFICVLLLFNGITVSAVFEGGLVDQDLTLSKWDSPFTIKHHIRVAQDAVLKLEAGVEMRFAPGMMMAVNGTLIAQVKQYKVQGTQLIVHLVRSFTCNNITHVTHVS